MLVDYGKTQQEHGRLLAQLTAHLPRHSEAPETFEEPELTLRKPKSRVLAAIDCLEAYQSVLCSQNRCCCVYHGSVSVQGRSWFLKLPSTLRIWEQCSLKSCQNARHYSLWLGLTQLGIPLAIHLNLDFVLNAQQYRILPSVCFQRVVRRTSPGFKLLHELETFQKRDWESARQEIPDLFTSGQCSPQDVDPDGRTWLEVCLLAACAEIFAKSKQENFVKTMVTWQQTYTVLIVGSACQNVNSVQYFKVSD